MQLDEFILNVQNNGGLNSLKLLSECVSLTKKSTSEWCLNWRPDKPNINIIKVIIYFHPYSIKASL